MASLYWGWLKVYPKIHYFITEIDLYVNINNQNIFECYIVIQLCWMI